MGIMTSWLTEELKPDTILALRLRAGRERDMVRHNISLSFTESIHMITEIDRKYASLIEEELSREVIIHAAARDTIRFIQAGIFSCEGIFRWEG
jgi:hypothetical protein